MSAPTLLDLRSACVDAGACGAVEFDEAVATQREMALRGERMSLLDVLVIQGSLAPERARTLRESGFGTLDLSAGESAPARSQAAAPPAAARSSLHTDATAAWSRDEVAEAAQAPAAGDVSGTVDFAPEDLHAALAGHAPPRRAADPGPLPGDANDVFEAAEATDFEPDVPFGSDFAGRTLGGCRLERELGRGAMGVVFEATHLSLQRRVAVKVLMPSARRGDRDVEQFFQEARALARIEHQNIVQVYDVDEQDGHCFIVMQLLHGETLADRLDRVRVLTWEEACRYARDIARGLAVAHEKGIVHRDIKPENVFLNADGAVKIADFGLAAPATNGAEGAGASEVMGTPAYMSPEQIDGRSVDGRADLYSLGCTLYAMLTGRKPFEGATAIEVLLKQTKDVATPVSRVVPSVPTSVSQVVEKLMAKLPQARYQKATDLAQDLEKILGGGKPKVVVEIEDVMGRMQELMQAAEQPRSSFLARPLVVVTCAVVILATLSIALVVALPAVEVPEIDMEMVLAVPVEERNAEAAAKAALAETEAFTSKIEDRADLVVQQYDELEKRWGHVFLAPIQASRELALERFEKRRETRFATLHAEATDLLRTDPLGAVQKFLAMPDSMRTGEELAEWTKDLERALGALRNATGMTYVPGGRSRGGPLKAPRETKPFLLDVCEVSNAEYAKFVEATKARPPRHWNAPTPPDVIRDLPVVGVTATEADAYAKWAGKRLPTGNEWERAARGTEGFAYPWGEEFDAARSNTRVTENGPALAAVISFPGGRSPDGAFHMAGNAMEWTADAATDPTLAGCREVRGGSTRSHPSQCATFVRYWVPENTDDPALFVGFRCARDP